MFLLDVDSDVGLGPAGVEDLAGVAGDIGLLALLQRLGPRLVALGPGLVGVGLQVVDVEQARAECAEAAQGRHERPQGLCYAEGSLGLAEAGNGRLRGLQGEIVGHLGILR